MPSCTFDTGNVLLLATGAAQGDRRTHVLSLILETKGQGCQWVTGAWRKRHTHHLFCSYCLFFLFKWGLLHHHIWLAQHLQDRHNRTLDSFHFFLMHSKTAGRKVMRICSEVSCLWRNWGWGLVHTGNDWHFRSTCEYCVVCMQGVSGWIQKRNVSFSKQLVSPRTTWNFKDSFASKVGEMLQNFWWNSRKKCHIVWNEATLHLPTKVFFGLFCFGSSLFGKGLNQVWHQFAVSLRTRALHGQTSLVRETKNDNWDFLVENCCVVSNLVKRWKRKGNQIWPFEFRTQPSLFAKKKSLLFWNTRKGDVCLISPQKCDCLPSLPFSSWILFFECWIAGTKQLFCDFSGVNFGVFWLIVGAVHCIWNRRESKG